MEAKAVWLAKHWGLGVGMLMSVFGFAVAAPGSMVTWRVSSRTDTVLGEKIQSTAATRVGESLPEEYTIVAVIRDSHEIKGLGVSSMILGSCLVLACSIALKAEYERLEKANWMIKQSEFQLSDIEFSQSIEVDRWAIELMAQTEIANMIRPPSNYHPQDDERSQKPEPEFSRSATGFFAWLQEKAAKLGKTTFDFHWCGSQTFVGKKLLKAEVTRWVDELAGAGLLEWIDEEKKTFKLVDE